MCRAPEPAEEATKAAYLHACDRLLWRIDRTRCELRDILARTEARIVQVPRRDVEHLLSWFDAVEDEDGAGIALKAAIADRIETLIACLDALDADPDLEDDERDSDDACEPDDLAA